MTNTDNLPQPNIFIPHLPGKGPRSNNQQNYHHPGVTKKPRLKFSGGGRRKKRKTKTKKKKVKVKRKIYTGPRGGKFYRKGGRKVYI